MGMVVVEKKLNMFDLEVENVTLKSASVAKEINNFIRILIPSYKGCSILDRNTVKAYFYSHSDTSVLDEFTINKVSEDDKVLVLSLSLPKLLDTLFKDFNKYIIMSVNVDEIKLEKKIELDRSLIAIEDDGDGKIKVTSNKRIELENKSGEDCDVQVILSESRVIIDLGSVHDIICDNNNKVTFFGSDCDQKKIKFTLMSDHILKLKYDENLDIVKVTL